MDTLLDHLDIRRILPHRYPFLLVDRVVELDLFKKITALKNVTINEPFFEGHFPHYPVMPGVLILEALAQVSAILSLKSVGTEIHDNAAYYLVGIDKARFKAPVLPGDQLILTSILQREIRGISVFQCQAHVAGKLVATTEMMCAIREI